MIQKTSFNASTPLVRQAPAVGRSAETASTAVVDSMEVVSTPSLGANPSRVEFENSIHEIARFHGHVVSPNPDGSFRVYRLGPAGTEIDEISLKGDRLEILDIDNPASWLQITLGNPVVPGAIARALHLVDGKTDLGRSLRGAFADTLEKFEQGNDIPCPRDTSWSATTSR
jgi:hypothetical protein